MMSPAAHVQIHAAQVRSGKAEALSSLIHQLFNRRNLSYIPANDRVWLTVELVQSLRRQSEVYRALSEKTSGPLPFGLGYLRIRGEAVEAVSDTLPIEDPEVLVRLLSEYVVPGARLTFTTAAEREVWRIEGKDEVARLDVANDPSRNGASQ